MQYPVSTYRLQFHKDFSFADFESLIPYFRKLGVGTIYASPIFAATAGSTHGYDGIDPSRIDSELGTLEQFRELSKELKKSNIGWLQDIVPNHMAYHHENQWLMDVLEKGGLSVYAPFFDISLNSQFFHGKIMAPFLGKELNDAIQTGEIALKYNDHRLTLDFGSSSFPVNLRSYLTVLNLSGAGQPQSAHQLVNLLKEIHETEDPKTYASQWNEFLLQLSALNRNKSFQTFFKNALDQINANKVLLTQLADQQEYLLCDWRKSEQEINFRRFFTVNSLICLNMQDDSVWEKYHQFVHLLLDEGIVQGLRIDHIDGLYNPANYLEKIRELAGKDTYIVVEKILEKNEKLPANWPVEGTSGYEFLAVLNNVFTNSAAEEAFTDYYQDLIQNEDPIRIHLLRKKAEILYEHMGGELENLYGLFVELELTEGKELEIVDKNNLKKAIGEFLIHCPVYRYYGTTMPLPEAENAAVGKILDEVAASHSELSGAVALLSKSLLEKPSSADEAYRSKALAFYQRLMQFSGPLMAKGGEDTLMYTYYRFIGHNEVGDFPDRFGVPVKDFHTYMRTRSNEWPFALSTTSTHDTKRGEDVRARLNVLTDLPRQWLDQVSKWRNLNSPLKEGKAGPDDNDEYLIYQTLTGAYPMPGEGSDDFPQRLSNYLEKAIREAKEQSSWAEPDYEYEQNVKGFAAQLLNEEGDFWQNFSSFHAKISDYGIVNSLAQLILKFTCPGVPDVYQGCELWDFSLVDPDNRRPVDYNLREASLKEFEERDVEVLLENLWLNRNDAKVKLWLTSALYRLRRDNPLLFTQGDYIALKTRGIYKDHLLAFARKYKKDFYVVVVPLHTAQLCEQQSEAFLDLDWKDTTVILPDNLSSDWLNVLTERNGKFPGKFHPQELFTHLPVAILKGSRLDSGRKAGVLMHITSLPSPFGIGDMGPEAFAFADFLEKGNQRLWQILPLNPIEEAQGNSPYSALCSRAGNPLLISPEELMKDDLLSAKTLSQYYLPQTGHVSFSKAQHVKAELLKMAYETFDQNANNADRADFEGFCTKNSEWLGDFALYMVLKEKHGSQPWYEWPEPFRLRDDNALQTVLKTEADGIRYIQWQQYIFDKQWKKLRAYCNGLNIGLLGDIPFYVSYDSSDVWSNRELFCVDEKGRITGVAGVPPDAFSDDGQLWGMPVFNWEALQAQDYQWWVARLAKNIELFDLIRLDHFRAFADYWQVPGGEKTAVNGEWKLGPDEAFFTKMHETFGNLPFIAEDLGEVSPEVFKLRDKFSLPGMKVLQFAFDENMPQSDHIAHNFSPNFIAYTGTHDNNTVKGWFRQSTEDALRSRIENYVGHDINEENVCEALARLTYGSVAKTAILPIQDVLNLDETSKMNSPGTHGDNWAWRLLPGQIDDKAAQFLANLTVLFNRD
ncbi:malto-oligosyltrehalose synthase [Dyadobacter pollutisoli]|uniref:4-alpha-glucanotransferase n=1 Tax=Dyadobacter pollutisoli TaxID=2910158 RepID=A0A9E8SNC5_9BACT|nr:malto-oligosyltrehalose synthase [Dyadobacter pollutisoli]WAC13606.1 malto-oligosyltrehalose synthase [Dyadobacter pollutisoli]